MQVTVSKGTIDKFKAQSKAAWPNETFAFLLGTKTPETILIKRIFVPRTVARHCGPDYVQIPFCWHTDARREARRLELVVLGDIHSHPTCVDTAPSEFDWDSMDNPEFIHGICAIWETKTKKLRSHVGFWPAIEALRVKVCA